MAFIVGFTVLASEGDDKAAAPIHLSEIPQDYRDWHLIAVSRLASPKGSQIRAQLGNDIAIKAYRENKLHFPTAQ